MLFPCLWFDGDGLEAAKFYVSLFEDSRVDSVSSGPDGSPLVINFTLMGRPFQALNGGPMYRFTEAISFSIPCKDQADVDRYWEALVEGGEAQSCGWLKDRFGVSWQVVPVELGELLGDPDPGRASRAREAMFSMQKIDVAAMRAAADS